MSAVFRPSMADRIVWLRSNRSLWKSLDNDIVCNVHRNPVLERLRVLMVQHKLYSAKTIPTDVHTTLFKLIRKIRARTV